MTILVAGIGNVFLGDDAFGVEVVARLRERGVPRGVRLVDFGIRGIDLAYALGECDAAILVDALARGLAPGTLSVIAPEIGAGGDASPEAHAMTPDRVLRSIPRARLPRTLLIVGCEPATFGDESLGRDGLSAPVAAAVPEAVRMVEDLTRDLLRGGAAGA